MVKGLIHGRRLAVLAAGLLATGMAGCAVANHDSDSEPKPQVISVSGPASGEEKVAPSRCAAGLSRCRSVEGRVVYAEAHDPDGDGEAHFVVLDSQGITLPGLTAIAVPPRLRPRPLPGPGDLISAAGQVQTGSHGEQEIKAVEVHVAGIGGR